MRANAPITAILALAALSLSPAQLLARPKHPTHKTTAPTTPAKNHPHNKSTAPATTTHSKPKHRTRRQRSADAPDPVTTTRVHHWVSTQPAPSETVATQAPRKATSDDFLRAAGPSPTPNTQQTPQPAPKMSAAKQTPVVNVIRTTDDHPQLESVEDAASSPAILPSLYNKRGRLIVPRPLKGSHEILLRQNQVADREGLDRIRDDGDILNMRNQGMLLALPASPALQVDERLPANRRYCRPWTAQFLATLARAHYERFHTPIQVNSAVRTVEFQQHLLRTNGNAAPAEGDTASPHLTGQAVDLAKHGLSLTEIAWLRGYLLPLVQQGKVDVEEEFQQSCFHISVYKKYLPSNSAPEREVASSHRGQTSALATAIR
jgi:Family of unknown function (DUF5715)